MTSPTPSRHNTHHHHRNQPPPQQHFSTSASSSRASEASLSSHAESIQERLSIVQQEVKSHKSRKSDQQRSSLLQCQEALGNFKVQFHDIEERIALQASDHRSEINLLENFIREALAKVEQTIQGDSDQQYEIFSQSAVVVEDKVKALERLVFSGDGVTSEEEQIGAVRREMNAAVEAARLLCEEEEEVANDELSELIDPAKMKTKNLGEISEIEFKAIERLVEDTRAQLLSLTAPAGARLEARQKEAVRALKEVRQGLIRYREDRELTFATLYDAMTELSKEMIKKASRND